MPLVKHPFVSASVLVGACVGILAAFAFKTVYYYSYARLYWWFYAALICVLFLFFVWYVRKPRSSAVVSVFALSLLLSWFPFELEYPRLTGLFSDQSETFLSGLATKLPGTAMPVLFDVLFWPILIAIPLAVAAFVARSMGRP